MSLLLLLTTHFPKVLSNIILDYRYGDKEYYDIELWYIGEDIKTVGNFIPRAGMKYETLYTRHLYYLMGYDDE